MRFPAFLLALSASASLAAVTPVPSEVSPKKISGAKPRSVVFILSDDHRYDAMSFMKHQFARTPHMDAMAANGVHLKNAFVTTSLCSPSRASILTGLYTFRHRVIDNNRLVPEGTLFFPQYLQKAGYATAFIGKWHMGGATDEPRPGFDRWVSFRGQGHYLPPSPDYTLNVDGKRVKQKGYITDELTDYAIDWLERQKPAEKPFFLYLSHKAVHAISRRRSGTKLAGRGSLPASGERSRDARELQAQAALAERPAQQLARGRFPYHSELNVERYYKRYSEALRAVDDSLGRITAQLKKMGVHDETLVIYMGDNGFMFGEHGLIDKRVAYETSIRVPMLAQCPELFPAGSAVEQVVANIDVGPTVLEAMGLEKPAHMDGQSFLRLAAGKETPGATTFSTSITGKRTFPTRPRNSPCAATATSTSPITACGTPMSFTICKPTRARRKT